MEPAGSELVYAIHSPARDLELDANKGKGTVLRFRELLLDSGRRRLESRPVAANDAAKEEEAIK